MAVTRRLISLNEAGNGLLDALAKSHHGGNASATVDAALEAYLDTLAARRERIRTAVIQLWQTTESDTTSDPRGGDGYANEPYRQLVALVGEEIARGVHEALVMIRTNGKKSHR